MKLHLQRCEKVLHHQSFIRFFNFQGYYFFTRKPPHIQLAWIPNNQKMLSSLNGTFSHISQLQVAYCHATGFSCASGHQSSAASCSLLDQTADIGDALLMSCRQPCTSPTTHAIVEATST